MKVHELLEILNREAEDTEVLLYNEHSGLWTDIRRIDRGKHDEVGSIIQFFDEAYLGDKDFPQPPKDASNAVSIVGW